ncbi:glyoxalase [Enterococcus phoeniculicola]|jgi:glyoxalase family protein|uniref:Glyoxalase n=1 Tax=Enterococcus phoeniculicola ATCC BAA-412 TaxID=1158610 RepID=R3U481_9ENTE|nr:ring-cleaving dioxygenase [Enterococcus phoeniculicola]EOL48734.1 glyoxalase [Enterococcus phoeniculicola ATCC BAA-412]EOT72580.1 glyoxalase [Enterococcus phoeniculicola ATCC BAA-412]OJG71853.1 glyoxalase [Enterococcus phoeniculicola]
MNQQILGLHHVTAITSSAEKIYHFFTDTLGLRLIKKTVNQDDIETYHLYFTDDLGSAGTDMTFFDFPGIPKGVKGTNTISRTSFRVKDDAALAYWISRFDDNQIEHGEISERFGKKYLEFEDFDNQRYQLISDEKNTGVAAGVPWKNSNVPAEHALIGLGPGFVTVQNYDHMKLVLEQVLGFKQTAVDGDFYLFEVGEGGNGASIIVEHRTDLPVAMEGFGNVHHLALRVEDREALEFWIKRLNQLEFPNSGFVQRFYFESEYFRAAPGILFELATDGPGFLEDETYETAGEILSLPPFLEPKRKEIEDYVRPFDTSKTNEKRK